MIRPRASEQWRRFSARLAGRIRAARITIGITQSQLASRCGVTRATIGNLEAQRNSVSLEMLVRISAGLGLPMAKLLEGTEPPRQLEPRRRTSETLSPAESEWARGLAEYLDDGNGGEDGGES